MNVQNMNNEKKDNQDSYKSFLLLDELSKEENLSQRDLSKRLNIALGLVNSYIKNLISKGYITIKNMPSNRYAYILTPKGFAEKSRLAYKHLQNFTNLYRIARHDYNVIFRTLEQKNLKKIAFCGVDEVAEIAYISLQEFSLELVIVSDDQRHTKKFFTHTVYSLEDLKSANIDQILITSFLNRDNLKRKLLEMGIPAEKIMSNIQR